MQGVVSKELIWTDDTWCELTSIYLRGYIYQYLTKILLNLKWLYRAMIITQNQLISNCTGVLSMLKIQFSGMVIFILFQIKYLENFTSYSINWHGILLIWCFFLLFVLSYHQKKYFQLYKFWDSPYVIFFHKKPGWGGEWLIEVGDPLTIRHLLSCHVYKQQNVMSQQQ